MAYINGKEILFSPAVNYTDENPILEAEASRAQKELENMKALGVVETMQEDSTVAYRKTVPANALPYAEVKEVGGMTYTSKNIFNAMAVNKSNVVVTDKGASITVTGDPNGDYNATDFIFEAGVYCATYGGTGTLCYVPAPAAFIEIKSGEPFTITEEVQIGCLAFGSNGGTFTNLMIVKGETPADFAPYIEGGMASATVTEIETVGKNLAVCTKDTTQTFCGLTLTRKNGKSFTVADGTATEENAIRLFGDFKLQAGTYTASVVGLNASDRLYVASGNAVLVNYVQTNAPKTFTIAEEKECFLQIIFASGSAYNNTEIKAQIEKGNTATEFAHYAKHTLPIPAEVQALEGYGLGISADCHNRIVWDVKNGVKQYRQEVRKIRLDGSETWNKSTASNIFQAGCPLSKIAGDTKTLRPIISNGYGFSDWYNPDASVKPYFRIVPNGDRLWLEATLEQFASADALKAYLAENPVEIVYPLAEAEVTDLTDVLLDDNFIAVEGGGTVTAVNANAFDVPTTIEYRVKE